MSQITDESQFKEILERDFLVADLQTLLKDLNLQQSGRKAELIERVLQNKDKHLVEVKRKITEVYKRKNLESMPQSARKAPPKKILTESSSSEEESVERTGKTSAAETTLIEGYYKRSSIQTALALVVLSCVAYGLINNKIDFVRYHKNKLNVTEVGPRIQYVLQHSTPGVVWLLFCTFLVISKRVQFRAHLVNPEREHFVESAKAIFSNSLEQFVMSLVSQLVLISYLTPKQVVNIIPVLNILFIVGRIAFWLGYPKTRAFGFTLSFVPLLATICFINYRYFGLFKMN